MTIIVWVSVIVAIGLAVAYWTMTNLRRLRVCPACSGELRLLPASTEESPPRTYDITYCTDCTHVSTVVHNQRGRFAYCPACRQLSLRSSATRHGEYRDIYAQETCEICGYSTEREIRVLDAIDLPVSTPNIEPQRAGKVLQFPGPRRLPSEEDAAET